MRHFFAYNYSIEGLKIKKNSRAQSFSQINCTFAKNIKTIKSMITATFNEVRNNFGIFFNRVIDDADTLVVNREGTDSAVLMSMNEYNSLMETLYLLSSPETMKDIRQADADLRNGKGIEINIDEL